MGAKQDWSHLRSRIAGKWQLPLLAISLALFAATIYRTRPEIPPVPFKESLAAIDGFLEQSNFSAALGASRELVARADLTDAQKAQVELRLGRTRFRISERSVIPQPALAAQIERHFRAASKELASPPLAVDDVVAAGRLAMWQKDFARAVALFERAVQLEHPEADDLLKEIYAIHRDRLEISPARLVNEVDRLMALLRTYRLDVRIWFIEERFDLAERLGALKEFAKNLDSEAKAFQGSDFEPRFELLRCRHLVASGETREAELRLRALRNQIESKNNEVASAAGWLLGTILVDQDADEKVSEGLSFFADVLEDGGGDSYAVACLVGQGAALARLARHEEAVASYRQALRRLGTVGDTRVVNLSSLRGSLAVTAETLRQKGDLHRAIEYSELAVELALAGSDEDKSLFTQPLALMEEQLGDEIGSRAGRGRELGTDSGTMIAEAARLYASSAGHFDSLAKWSVLDEPRNADFSWKAAELWGKAGQTEEAIRRYRDFVLDRPNDRRGPTAMLRTGHLYYSSGRLAEAVEAFQECNRRYPQSFDGARAVIPLARTYMVMGPSRYADAERALMLVLDDSDVFTPEAGEFVEALFLLGEIFERAERYEPAISRLQEAIDRYPDDPRAARGRFLMGGAYRKSALRLREQAAESGSVAELTRIHQESSRRFDAARMVYRQLIHQLEYRDADEFKDRERLYLQHSYLYEADCYFETQRYADALKHYEHAASRLRDSARGLSAHVQVINCHVFLGQMREARVALARAMVAVSTLPENAFENRVATDSREAWKSYFEWLENGGLFESG